MDRIPETEVVEDGPDHEAPNGNLHHVTPDSQGEIVTGSQTTSSAYRRAPETRPGLTALRVARRYSVPATLQHETPGDVLLNDDDDAPLINNADWLHRHRLSVPNKLPIPEVTAQSLGLQIYTRRFYILFLFCLVTFVNGMLVYMFVSVAKTVEFVFDMTDTELVLLQNYSAIGFLVGVWPCCYILETSGLRLATILAASCQFVGSVLKVLIAFYPQTYRWAMHIGTFLASLGGPLAFVAPTYLSSFWFPASERTVSTALGAYSTGLGVGCIVLIEPFFLSINNPNGSDINASEPVSNSTEHHKAVLFDDVMLIFYMQLGLAATCLMLTIAYFPNKPPTPPTLSASSQRVSPIQGLIRLLKSVDYHAMVVINLQYAINQSYLSMMDVLLYPLGYTETEVGIMGGLLLALGTLAAVFGGWLGSIFPQRFKTILLILFFLSGPPLVWFSLIVLKYLPADSVSVYTSVILWGIAINAPAALFFEAVIEHTYPVGEGISISYLTFIGNLTRSILFALPQLPGIGVEWINWLMIGVAFLPMPMLVVYKQKYNRLDTDLTVSDTAPDMSVIGS